MPHDCNGLLQPRVTRCVVQRSKYVKKLLQYRTEQKQNNNKTLPCTCRLTMGFPKGHSQLQGSHPPKSPLLFMVDKTGIHMGTTRPDSYLPGDHPYHSDPPMGYLLVLDSPFVS